jgi:hypothetical protein
MLRTGGLLITLEEANNILGWENSYSRMERCLSLQRVLPRREWLKLLGEWWSCCDNINLYRSQLKRTLSHKTPRLEMMTDEEIARFNALPDEVIIYRGCGAINMDGASWTLDKAVALRFPFLTRYRADYPLLITATVKKSDIVAVNLERNESEVITFKAVPVSVEQLSEEHDPALKLSQEAT